MGLNNNVKNLNTVQALTFIVILYFHDISVVPIPSAILCTLKTK